MKNKANKFSFIIVILVCILNICSCSLFLKNLNNSSAKPINFSQLKYLAFGDSITHGNYLENSYPKLVVEILGCKSYLNKGVGGSTYVHKDGRNCIGDDVPYYLNKIGHYDIISVAGGVNDHDLSFPLGTISDTTTETIYGSLNIIARTLKSTDSFVFFITPIKYDRDRVNYENYELKDIATAVIEVGKKYDIPVLDLYSTSQFEIVGCGMNNNECDGTHPIQEYMTDYMAPKIANFIKDNYKN